MGKKLLVTLIIVIFLMGQGKISYAMSGCSMGDDEAGSAQTTGKAPASKAADVGNKVCPVTGENISESSKATYEYNGKVYNFCCAMCIPTFKKNPEKYIEIINKEKAQ